MDNVEQERAASPRPWRLGFTEYRLAIRDADRRLILAFLSHSPDAEKDAETDMVNTANAELILDAVNAFDRIRAKEQIITKMADAIATERDRLRETLARVSKVIGAVELVGLESPFATSGDGMDDNMTIEDKDGMPVLDNDIISCMNACASLKKILAEARAAIGKEAVNG